MKRVATIEEIKRVERWLAAKGCRLVIGMTTSGGKPAVIPDSVLTGKP